MSLVNDALKKARMEAARGDAAKRGIPYPVLGRGESSSSARPILAGAAIVALAIAGYFLYSAGQRSALENVAAVETSPAATDRPAELEERSEPADVLLEPAAAEPASTQPKRAEPRPPTANRAATANRSEPPPRRPETTTPRTVAPAQDESESEPEPVVAVRSPEPETPAMAGAPTNVTSTSEEPERETEAAPAEPAAGAEVAEEDSTPAEQEFVRRADIPGVGPVELGGIAWSGDRPFALLNGRVVRPGDSVSGLRVEQIQPNTVRLIGDTGTVVLKLK